MATFATESEQESSDKTPSFDWILWLKWILVSTLGWVIGWALAGEMTIGVVIGVMQGIILYPLVPQAGWWVLASAVGWAVGQMLVVTTFPTEVGVIAGAFLGVILGISQWIVLRRWFFQAGWWIIMSTLGWALGLAGMLGPSLVGAVVGATTGFTLELLLRHPRPPVSN
jgi:hypothetical protein